MVWNWIFVGDEFWFVSLKGFSVIMNDAFDIIWFIFILLILFMRLKITLCLVYACYVVRVWLICELAYFQAFFEMQRIFFLIFFN